MEKNTRIGMKQFTNAEQTAKLIELGFEPSTRIPFEVGNDELGRTFSIGELIEMLPENLNGWQLLMHYSTHFHKWCAYYLCDGDTSELYLRLSAQEDELIDALYEMAIKLKEEGVI